MSTNVPVKCKTCKNTVAVQAFDKPAEAAAAAAATVVPCPTPGNSLCARRLKQKKHKGAEDKAVKPAEDKAADDDLDDKSANALRELCEAEELPVSGNRTTLIARLRGVA